MTVFLRAFITVILWVCIIAFSQSSYADYSGQVGRVACHQKLDLAVIDIAFENSAYFANRDYDERIIPFYAFVIDDPKEKVDVESADWSFGSERCKTQYQKNKIDLFVSSDLQRREVEGQLPFTFNIWKNGIDIIGKQVSYYKSDPTNLRTLDEFVKYNRIIINKNKIYGCQNRYAVLDQLSDVNPVKYHEDWDKPCELIDEVEDKCCMGPFKTVGIKYVGGKPGGVTQEIRVKRMSEKCEMTGIITDYIGAEKKESKELTLNKCRYVFQRAFELENAGFKPHHSYGTAVDFGERSLWLVTDHGQIGYSWRAPFQREGDEMAYNKLSETVWRLVRKELEGDYYYFEQ